MNEAAMVLTGDEWEDMGAVCQHFLDATRWVDRNDHGYRDEHIAELKRKRDLCERVVNAA